MTTGTRCPPGYTWDEGSQQCVFSTSEGDFYAPEIKPPQTDLGDLTRKLLPEYYTGSQPEYWTDFDFKRLQSDLETNPDKVIKSLQAKGRTPETESWLRAIGGTQQEIDDLFKTPAQPEQQGIIPPSEPPPQQPPISETGWVQQTTGEFGGQELMPVSPEMLAIITKQEVDAQALSASLLKLYPGSDLTGISDFAQTNPEDFLKAVREQGRSAETDNILHAFNPTLTENDLREFWGQPKQITSFDDLVKLGFDQTWQSVGNLIEGIFSPYKGEDIGRKAAASFVAGIGDVFSTSAGASRWLGFGDVGNVLSAIGSKLQQVAPPDTSGEFEISDLLNPEFYATKITRTIPFALSLAPMAIGGYGGGAAIAAVFGVPRIGSMIIGGLAGAALSRPLESAMEAGSQYDDAIARGKTEAEAKVEADEVFKKNMVLAGADAFEIAIALAPTPKWVPASLVKAGLVRTALIAGKMVIVGLSEGGEEVFQDMFQRHARGEEWKLDPVSKEVFAIGAVMGLGMGLGGDVVSGIVDKAKTNITGGLKGKFNDVVSKGVADGLRTDQAELRALDVIVQTPEGESLIGKIVREVKETGKAIITEERGAIGKVPEPAKEPSIKVGDTISDGLVSGKVTGEGTIGKKNIPAYKIELPNGETDLIIKDQVTRVEPSTPPVAVPEAKAPEKVTPALPKAEPGMPEAGYRKQTEAFAPGVPKDLKRAYDLLAGYGKTGVANIKQFSVTQLDSFRLLKQQGLVETWRKEGKTWYRVKPVPVEAAKPSVAPPAAPEVAAAVEAEAIKAEGRNIPTPEQKASIPPNLPPEEQVAAHINFEPDKVSLKEQFESGKNKAIVHWIDRLYPIDKFVKEARKTGIDLSIEENPYLLARLMEGVTSKATSFIENGTFGRDFWKMEKGKAVPNYKGEGLSQILEPVKEPVAWRDFSTYLVSLRAKELADLGIESGIDAGLAKNSIVELEEKYQDFPKIVAKIQKYQKDLLDYVQDSGLISQELRDKLDAKYYAYVPFYRVMDELASKGYMGKKMVDIASPIKRIKGSTREIINPLESIIKNTYAMINAADRNQVGVTMARIAHDVPAVVDMFKHIKTPIAKVATVTAKELGIEVEGLSESETEEVFNVFRPSLFKAENVATVLIDGKKQFFEVDPDLNKALHVVDVGSLGILWKVLSAPAKWLRAGATLTPDFMIRNPARDALSAFVFSKYGFIPGVDFVKGVASVLNADKAYQLYKMSGAEHSMLVSLDRDYLQKTFKEVVEGKKFTDYVKHPLTLLQIVSELGEKATRLGEFKKGLSQGALPLETGMASREVTLDFAKAGTQARAVNQIIAFFNATIRGWERPIQAFKEAPVKTSAKIFLGITLPSLILWTINHDEDWYKEVPQWQKDLFWLVKIGDNIYRIPKPFELGLIFGSLPERFLDYLVDKDPEAMKQFTTSLFGSSLPGWIPTGLEPIIENITNHSFFRGAPIVSEGKGALPPEFQYTQWTSEVAKGLGSVLKQSPAKIDNLIQGWTGGLGRYATQAIDKLLQGTGVVPEKIEPSPTAADIPVLKAFVVRNPIGGASASVEKFYDILDGFTGQEQRLKLLLEDGKKAEYETEKLKHPELLLNYDDTTNTVYSATARYLRQVSGEMSDIRKLQDKIYKDTKMTPEKKRELIDGLDTIKTQLSQKALALIKNPSNEVGILEVPVQDLENKLGTVLNPVPPISNEKPDVYGMPNLGKELGQAKGESKLKTLLEKNNKILTDIANLPDSALYKIDRTVSKAGLTRIQNALLDQYDAAENKKAFIELHPEVKINPKADWLKKNPESNAILALWGNAKILTQKAYDIAQDLIESNDVPENAFPLKTMPPKEVAKANFDYQEAEDKYGANSPQARLIRTDDKFNTWLKLERIDEDVKGLELKVKTYDKTKEYEAFSDKDSPTYKDDVKKNADGLTERDLAQMAFKASNPLWQEDRDRIDAHSKGTRDKPTPDNIVDKWVDKGRVARESKGYDAEEKVWYLDNKDIHKWALENKLTSDDGSKWNEPALRIQVKPENIKVEQTIADYKKTLPDVPNKNDPNYKNGYQYRIEQLKATKEGQAYDEDKDRIYAFQNNGEALVEPFVKYGQTARKFGGGSYEAKLVRYKDNALNLWGTDRTFEGGDKWESLDTTKVKVWEIGVLWRKEEDEYNAILAKFGAKETKAQTTAIKEYLGKNEKYGIARRQMEAYGLGLDKTGRGYIDDYVKHYQYSSEAERNLNFKESPDFERNLWIARHPGEEIKYVSSVENKRIPGLKLEVQFKDQIAVWDTLSVPESDNFQSDVKDYTTGKSARDIKREQMLLDRDFADAHYRIEAYDYMSKKGYQIRDKYNNPQAKGNPIDDYVSYKMQPDKPKLRPGEKDAGFYEDDWWMQAHPDYYKEVYLGVLGNERKDYRKVPSRGVFAKYVIYLTKIEGKPREDFRRDNPDLEAWLLLTGKVTQSIKKKARREGLTPTERLAEEVAKRTQAIANLRKPVRF